jgi:hypothetical protein
VDTAYQRLLTVCLQCTDGATGAVVASLDVKNLNMLPVMLTYGANGQELFVGACRQWCHHMTL